MGIATKIAAVSQAAIQAIADPQARAAVRALADNLAVRSGDIGNGDQAFLTAGDFKEGGYKADIVANEVAKKIGSGMSKPGSPMFALADRLAARVLSLPEWHALFTRIGLLDAPDTTPGSLAYQMLAEARARGAAISQVERTIQTDRESLASTVELITAAIGDNAAAIETEKEARTTAEEATAKVIETIAAAVEDNAAAIQDESTARADAVSAEAKRITTLVADTDKSISGIEKSLEVKTNNDNALAKALNTLWARVGDNSALVQTGEEIAVNETGSVVTKFDQLQAVIDDPVTGLAASTAALRTEYNVVNSRVDGMKGTWSFKLDLDGYVAGMSLNAVKDTEGVSRSNILFNVGTFAVGAPGKPSEVPFAIDAETGLVGIRGDLVVRGSITGHQIAAESIDRDKLALKVIGGAQIDDLAVDTLQIKGNAVTVPVSVSASNTIEGIGRYVWNDAMYAEFDMPQDGYLYAHGMLNQNYGQGMRAWNAEMLIDGEMVWYCGGESVETTPSLSGSRFVRAGRHTVLVRWSGEVGVRINQRTLFAQLVMR